MFEILHELTWGFFEVLMGLFFLALSMGIMFLVTALQWGIITVIIFAVSWLIKEIKNLIFRLA